MTAYVAVMRPIPDPVGELNRKVTGYAAKLDWAPTAYVAAQRQNPSPAPELNRKVTSYSAKLDWTPTSYVAASRNQQYTLVPTAPSGSGNHIPI